MAGSRSRLLAFKRSQSMNEPSQQIVTPRHVCNLHDCITPTKTSTQLPLGGVSNWHQTPRLWVSLRSELAEGRDEMPMLVDAGTLFPGRGRTAMTPGGFLFHLCVLLATILLATVGCAAPLPQVAPALPPTLPAAGSVRAGPPTPSRSHLAAHAVQDAAAPEEPHAAAHDASGAHLIDGPHPAGIAGSVHAPPAPPQQPHVGVFDSYIAARSRRGLASADSDSVVPVPRLPPSSDPARLAAETAAKLAAIDAGGARVARNGHTLFSGQTYRAPHQPASVSAAAAAAAASDAVHAVGAGEAVEAGAPPPDNADAHPAAHEPNVAGEEHLTDAQLAVAHERVALLAEAAPPATTETAVKVFMVLGLTVLAVLGLLSCARNIDGKGKRSLIRKLRAPKDRDAEV